MNDSQPSLQSGRHTPSPFLAACRGQPATPIPVWFPVTRPGAPSQDQEQGSARPLPEVFQSPHAIQQATLDPVLSLNPDAVSLFSDGMLPLQGMGLQLEADRGDQLQADPPLRSPRDIDLLGTPPAEEHLAPILSAIPTLRKKCQARGLPLAGWAKGPLSLAADAVDGPRSASTEKTRGFLYRHPAAWKRLMEKLVTVTADYVQRQARAGAQALFIHDPVSGMLLPPEDYRRHILPHLEELLQKLRNVEVPILYHSALRQPLLGEVARMVDVISLDYRTPLGTVFNNLNPGQAVQVTLDPVLFSASWREVKAHLAAFLTEIKSRPGTLLGIIDPGTGTARPQNLQRTVEFIHNETEQHTISARGAVRKLTGGKA